MEEILRKITIDEVYISPLKRRRVRREDGSEIMEEVPHAIRPSGSMIMDAVVQILFFRRIIQINSTSRVRFRWRPSASPGPASRRCLMCSRRRSGVRRRPIAAAIGIGISGFGMSGNIIKI